MPPFCASRHLESQPTWPGAGPHSVSTTTDLLTLGTMAGDIGTRLIGLLITGSLPTSAHGRSETIRHNSHPPYIYSPIPSHLPRVFILLMLILWGEVEINPGPGAKSTFPCGYCELAVNWSQKGICCDDCSLWVHKMC